LAAHYFAEPAGQRGHLAAAGLVVVTLRLPRPDGFSTPSQVTSVVVTLVGVGWVLVAELMTLTALEAIVPTGSVPSPLGWLRTLPARRRRAVRYTRIVGIAARYGLGRYFRRRGGPDLPQSQLARSLREALSEAGVTFVKLGQMLSTRPDIVGPTVSAELSRLQSDAPAEDWMVIRRLIETELGQSIDEVFSKVDARPLAAASVAQLHAATLPTGESVVIKVQRPRARQGREMPLVTLLCGPAGAGKTTHARRLALAGAVRLSMDEATWADGWRQDQPPRERLDALYAGLMDDLRTAAAAGQDVVVDLSLSERSVRDEWRALAADVGADVELLVFTAPFEVLWQRVKRRNDSEHANAVRLTESRLRAYVDGFNWPGADEHAQVITTA